MGDMAAFSNAVPVEYFEGNDVFLPGSPTSAIFADVRDLARLTFTTPAGDLVVLALPAPNSGIFLPDTVTVDASAIALIISDCIGNLCTPSGVAVTAYVAGARNQRASGG